jgi:hypothetical protein
MKVTWKKLGLCLGMMLIPLAISVFGVIVCFDGAFLVLNFAAPLIVVVPRVDSPYLFWTLLTVTAMFQYLFYSLVILRGIHQDRYPEVLIAIAFIHLAGCVIVALSQMLGIF